MIIADIGEKKSSKSLAPGVYLSLYVWLVSTQNRQQWSHVLLYTCHSTRLGLPLSRGCSSDINLRHLTCLSYLISDQTFLTVKLRLYFIPKELKKIKKQRTKWRYKYACIAYNYKEVLPALNKTRNFLTRFTDLLTSLNEIKYLLIWANNQRQLSNKEKPRYKQLQRCRSKINVPHVRVIPLVKSKLI